MSRDYDSNFDTESETEDKRIAKRRSDSLNNLYTNPNKKQKPSKNEFISESDKNERKLRTNFHSLDAYSRHKLLVNEYILTYPGSTAKLVRNTSKDKTEYEVLRDNHRFIWSEDEPEEDLSWGQRLAKKYYNQLFKEYCISDLSRYKDNKFGMRWRTQNEVIEGKGQFSCGAKHCDQREGLKSWEVFFSYIELGEKKSALVKLRLCDDCSQKLNYRQKRKEIKKRKKSNKSDKRKTSNSTSDNESTNETQSTDPLQPGVSGSSDKTRDIESTSESNIWAKPQPIPDVEKAIDEEFDEYLEDLLL